jgi:lipopolysaccharide heptosyltransferase I
MVSSMVNPKYLILRLSAVGDVLRTLPAVKAIKEQLPLSYIAWVVEEPSLTLLRSQPGIDEVILFPRKRWSSGIRSIQGVWDTLKEMKQFIFDIRERKFDVVLDFHGILKSGILSRLSGAPRRVGYDRRSTKEGNFLFSNVKVTLSGGMSRQDRNFSLLRGIGLELKGGDYPLHIPAEDRDFVDAFFTACSPVKRPLIAIHPGTSPKTAYKRWNPDSYSRLGDRLVKELKASVLFTWGQGELEWVRGIQKGMQERSRVAPRTETLAQLGEILRRCDLYIGGDTGPMHLASMVGTPVVVLYGPTDPLVNEPMGIHRKIRKEVGCNPCRDRNCKTLRCLDSITVEDVLKGARELLSRPSSASGGGGAG